MFVGEGTYDSSHRRSVLAAALLQYVIKGGSCFRASQQSYSLTEEAPKLICDSDIIHRGLRQY